VIRRHIDRIAEVTGGYAHIAIGSDFDGFIKPTMGGLEKISDLRKLEPLLREDYGDNAKLITSGNAIRVLRQLWSE
jgi:microsomal dipeptidase-like Zn-dependent dipeptidase